MKRMAILLLLLILTSCAGKKPAQHFWEIKNPETKINVQYLLIEEIEKKDQFLDIFKTHIIPKETKSLSLKLRIQNPEKAYHAIQLNITLFEENKTLNGSFIGIIYNGEREEHEYTIPLPTLEKEEYIEIDILLKNEEGRLLLSIPIPYKDS